LVKRVDVRIKNEKDVFDFHDTHTDSDAGNTVIENAKLKAVSYQKFLPSCQPLRDPIEKTLFIILLSFHRCGLIMMGPVSSTTTLM